MTTRELLQRATKALDSLRTRNLVMQEGYDSNKRTAASTWQTLNDVKKAALGQHDSAIGLQLSDLPQAVKNIRMERNQLRDYKRTREGTSVPHTVTKAKLDSTKRALEAVKAQREKSDDLLLRIQAAMTDTVGFVPLWDIPKRIRAIHEGDYTKTLLVVETERDVLQGRVRKLAEGSSPSQQELDDAVLLRRAAEVDVKVWQEAKQRLEATLNNVRTAVAGDGVGVADCDLAQTIYGLRERMQVSANVSQRADDRLTKIEDKLGAAVTELSTYGAKLVATKEELNTTLDELRSVECDRDRLRVEVRHIDSSDRLKLEIIDETVEVLLQAGFNDRSTGLKARVVALVAERDKIRELLDVPELPDESDLPDPGGPAPFKVGDTVRFKAKVVPQDRLPSKMKVGAVELRETGWMFHLRGDEPGPYPAEDLERVGLQISSYVSPGVFIQEIDTPPATVAAYAVGEWVRLRGQREPSMKVERVSLTGTTCEYYLSGDTAVSRHASELVVAKV